MKQSTKKISPSKSKSKNLASAPLNAPQDSGEAVSPELSARMGKLTVSMYKACLLAYETFIALSRASGKTLKQYGIQSVSVYDLLRWVGQNYSSAKSAELVKKYFPNYPDLARTGTCELSDEQHMESLLTEDEFIAYCRSDDYLPLTSSSDLMAVLPELSANENSKSIDLGKLRFMLTSVGEKLAPSEVQELISHLESKAADTKQIDIASIADALVALDSGIKFVTN